jgi:heat shock protein HtpX
LILYYEYYISYKEVLEDINSVELSVDSELGQIIDNDLEKISEDMDIIKPEVHIGKLGEPNALAIGSKNNGHIILSLELVKLLNRNELKSVLAHEASHIKSRDILIIMIWNYHMKKISIIKGVLFSLIFSFLPRRNRKVLKQNYMYIFSRFLSFLFLYPILRWRELEADRDAKDSIKNGGENLIRALTKINSDQSKYDKKQSKSTDLNRDIMIFNKSKYRKYFSTHPPIEKRKENLKAKSR